MAQTATGKNWQKWLLIGSLALNVLIIGLLIGAMLRGPDRQKRPPNFNGGLPGLIRAVPEGHHKTMKDAFREQKAAHADLRRELGVLRREFIVALQAEPFDMGVVEAALDKHRAVTSRISDTGRETILKTIAAMSEEDRQEFAANLQKRRSRR